MYKPDFFTLIKKSFSDNFQFCHIFNKIIIYNSCLYRTRIHRFF